MLGKCVSNGNANILESEHGLSVSQAVNFYRFAFGVSGKSGFGFGSLRTEPF